MKALSQLLRGRRAGGGGQTAMFAAKIILYLEQPNYPTSSSWPAASHSLAGPRGEQREYIYTLGVMKHCYANTSSTIMGPCTTYYICHDARVSSECIFQTSCVNTMCSAPANNRIGRNFLQIFIAGFARGFNHMLDVGGAGLQDASIFICKLNRNLSWLLWNCRRAAAEWYLQDLQVLLCSEPILEDTNAK